MRIVSVRVLSIITLCSFIAACSGSCRGDDAPHQSLAAAAQTPPPNVEAPAAAEQLPRGPWTELAKRLVESRDLETAVTTTREVLARGGVATFDGTRALVNVTMPASALRMSPLETVHMAMEARRRVTASRMTAAELAQMLEAFGFPFPGAREGGGMASQEPFGAVNPADDAWLRQAAQDGEKARREAEQRGQASLSQQVEQETAASRARLDAAQQRIRELTDAWQKARQAVGKTPPAERPAAEARVKQAWDARMAAIKELGVIRQAEDKGEDERRTRESRASSGASRAESIQRRIGPDFVNGEPSRSTGASCSRAISARNSGVKFRGSLGFAAALRTQVPSICMRRSPFTKSGPMRR